MTSSKTETTIRIELEDLDDRFAAGVESAIRQVKLGTAPTKLVELIFNLHNGMVRNVDGTIVHLTPTIGRAHAVRIVAHAAENMVGMLHLLAAQLREIALYGVARKPYIRKPGFNPHRSDNSPRVYHPAPKKVTPPAPKPVPGEGPGPNPVPFMGKTKGVKKWEDGVDAWGNSENWEDLAMHVANNEGLEMNKVMKAREVAEAEEALKAKGGVTGKKGKA